MFLVSEKGTAMKIRITSTPPGEADEAIRDEWIGVEVETLSPKEAESVQCAQWGDFVPGYYVVRMSDALFALGCAGHHTAASFWRELSSNVECYFRFPLAHCTIITR